MSSACWVEYGQLEVLLLVVSYYDTMKIETNRRKYVAAGGIYQHASAAAESLSRVNLAGPPARRGLREAATRSGKPLHM
jgi:hypothetical protein